MLSADGGQSSATQDTRAASPPGFPMNEPREFDPPGPPAGARRDWLGRVALIAVAGGVLATAYGFGLQRELSIETLVRERVAIEQFVAMHHLAAVLVFVGLYISVTAFAVPGGGALLVVAGGFLFGALIGGPAAMVGSTIGSAIIYAVAKSAAGDRLARIEGRQAQRFAAGFRQDAFSYILFLRMVPAPSWMVSSAAAVMGVQFWTFVAATALGRAPGSLVFALFGSGLDTVIDSQEIAYRNCVESGVLDCRIDFDPASVLTTTIVAAFVGLGLLALAPVIARRLWRRRTGVAVQPER
jgi:uncharacterized membrane protein YdjX (TVP38/TMEM64 family)